MKHPSQDAAFGAGKQSVVDDLFLLPADKDYVVARWSYQNGLGGPFFWNAAQAIEKYLKASLLMNGRSAKDQGHNLDDLYETVSEYCGELFPERLEMPPQLSTVFEKTKWRSESPGDFIKRINLFGDSNNRYNLFGYWQDWHDLFHLDQMIWSIRRVGVDLERCPFPRSIPDAPQNVRGLLLSNPNHARPMPLVKQIGRDNSDNPLRHALLELNYAFAPDDYVHDLNQLNLRSGSMHTVLSSLILDHIGRDTDDDQAIVAARLAEWILANVRLPKDLRERKMEPALKKLRDDK